MGSPLRHIRHPIPQTHRRILWDDRHRGVPRLPLHTHCGEAVGLAFGAVGAFAFVLAQVEEVVVTVDPEILPVADAQRALAAMLHAPVKRPVEAVLSVAQHAVELVAHRFAAARVKLKLRAEPDVPQIRGDQPLIEHAIVNLLLNACDACAAGGQVELSIRAEGCTAVFTVLDSGSTEEAARPAAAPSFTDGPTGPSSGHGFGLGLAVAQEILKGHRGALALKPCPKGGTCAEARIPLLPAPCTP